MKVGLFIRVSTLDQVNNTDSVETHIERGKLYAKSKGWAVIKIYNLAGVSGKSTIKHKEAQQMLIDIRHGIVDGIIISSLSRLARNTSELLEYSKFFEEHNASLISINESLDTSTSGGKFFYTLLSALSTYEREITYERQIASLNYRRQQGKFTGGNVSYGFKIVDAEVEIDEEKAPIRKLMYDLFLKHQRMASVARELNENGYRTAKGKKWSDTTVRRLLKNTDAKGVRRCNYRKPKTEDDPSRLKPQSEWIYLPCPAIISEEKWEEVNAIIRDQEKGSVHKQPLNKRVHVFTGYLKCDKGHNMHVVTKSGNYRCKKCKLRVHKNDMEEVFLSRIKKFLISDEEISAYTLSTEEELHQKHEEVTYAEHELEKINTKLERLIELNISGEIPTKGFKKHYDPVYEQKENIEIKIKDLKSDIVKLKEAQSSFKTKAKQSISFYENWHNLERHEKRFVVESIAKEIIFDGISIKFKLKQIAPLSVFEKGKNGQHCGITSSPGGKQQTSSKIMSPKDVKSSFQEN